MAKTDEKGIVEEGQSYEQGRSQRQNRQKPYHLVERRRYIIGKVREKPTPDEGHLQLPKQM